MYMQLNSLNSILCLARTCISRHPFPRFYLVSLKLQMWVICFTRPQETCNLDKNRKYQKWEKRETKCRCLCAMRQRLSVRDDVEGSATVPLDTFLRNQTQVRLKHLLKSCLIQLDFPGDLGGQKWRRLQWSEALTRDRTGDKEEACFSSLTSPVTSPWLPSHPPSFCLFLLCEGRIPRQPFKI